MKIPEGAPLDAAWEKSVDTFMKDVEGGEIGFLAQLVRARQIAWESMNEQQLPPGFWIAHHCGTARCVNPAHSELRPIGELER